MSFRTKISNMTLALACTSTLMGVVVNNETDLNTEIINANSGSVSIIQFGSSFNYSQIFQPLNADNVLNPTNQTFTIDGLGETLTTGGTFRGFFARESANPVTIQNLTISGAHARGGNAGAGGGGGLGAGGGLFLNAGSTVVIDNVTFQNTSATGGNGVIGVTDGAGGGGGLSGIGGKQITLPNVPGGAGGGGFNGSGGNTSGSGGGGGGGFNGGSGINTGAGGAGGGGGGFNGGLGSGLGGGGGAGDFGNGVNSTSNGGNGGAGSGAVGGNGGTAGAGGFGGGGGGGGSGGVSGTPGNTGGNGGAATIVTKGLGGTGANGVGGGGGGGASSGGGNMGVSGGAGGSGDSGFGGGGGGTGGTGGGAGPGGPGAIGGAGGFGGGGGGAGGGGDAGSSSGIGGTGGLGGYGGGGGGGAGGGDSFSASGGGGGTGGSGGFGGGGGGGGFAIGGLGGGPVGAGGGSLFGGGSGSPGVAGVSAGTGGGGAALGGAVFIENAAHLIIQTAVSFAGSGTTGGTGANNGLADGLDIFMMSGGQITVQNLTTNSAVPSPIVSDRGLTPSGGLTLDAGNTAIFTLNGTNTYTGTTTVNSGSLNVEGSVITPVVINGGSFGGNASLNVDGSVLNSGDLTNNGGFIRPGGDAMFGTINIGKNLQFSGGSSFFDAEIDSLGNTDYIDVTGTATLNGALDVQVAVGNFLEGEVITILNANGGVTGTFPTETLPLQPNGGPLFRVEYTANKVNLVVIADAIFQEGLTGQTIHKKNPRKVVEHLIDLLPIHPTSDLGFIVESLGLVSNDDINKVLNLLHPGSFGIFEWINLTTNGKIMELFSNRMTGRQTFSSSEIALLETSLTAANNDGPFYSNAPIRKGCSRDPNKQHGVWLQTFGTWNAQSQKGELRGSHYDTAGFLSGYDYTFDHWYVGSGLGYAYTNFRWSGSAGKGHINQVYGGAYSGYFNKYFGADLSTMVGGNFYQTDRFIRYSAANHPGSTVNRKAHSSSSGFQWTNHLGLIGDFNSLSVPLQVFANLDHFYLQNSSFNETGAKSINLSVNQKTSNALRSELGISSSYKFHVSHGCWTPYVALSWVNKTPLSSSSYRGAFRGQRSTFSVSASSKGVNQWAPQVGIEFANVHGFSLLLNSRAELNGKMKNYSTDMNIWYNF